MIESSTILNRRLEEAGSKAAVCLFGKLLQLSYIEQCILLDHIEEGMTIEDLVASLKSSASHEAKSIAKRIEALSEELGGSGEQDMANDEGRKMSDNLKPCPFCGGKAAFVYDSVECSVCGARMSGIFNKSEAIGLWNTRIVRTADTERKSMVDADIEMVKQNVIMGISRTKHPGEDAWEPTITAARLFEKAEKALLRDADAYFAQRAAQEALSLLKANEQQIEQLHTLLEQEGSEDGR